MRGTVFTLGQRVTMTGTIEKKKDRNHIPRRTWYEKAGLPDSGVYGSTDMFSEGVIVGKRSVIGGMTYYSEYEFPHFVPDTATRFTVWLVAFSLHRTPVMCAAEQLEARP